MHSSMKYFLTLILGGVIVGSILIATGANAQNDTPDEFETAAPTVVDATLSIDSIFQYQGQLLNSGGTPVNGVLPMTFRLYDAATGGNVLWGQNKSVTVSDGWFTVPLGDENSPISDEILDGRNLWLGVQVGGDAETSPRQPIRPAMFAVNSRMLNGKTSDNFLEARRGAIAYGHVKGSGGRESGWHFTSGYNAADTRYEIGLEVDNVPLNYDTNTFTTVVTALEGSSCPGATIATTNASNGKLIVYLHELNGNFRQCAFNFMTIKNK
jgi:hypothetical protein